MTDNKTPLHEMVAEDRIDALQDVFEKEGIKDVAKQKLISYLIGVQEKHAETEADVDFDSLDEANGNLTSDVNVLAKMMNPMITRGFGQSAATEICGNWPMKADQGKIAYMQNYYTEDQANPVKPADSKILVLADASTFSVDGDITGQATGAGTVRYIEDNTVFVEVSSGTFSVGQNVDNASPYSAAETTISAIYTAEIAQNVFAEYTKFATLVAGENATTNIKEVEIGVNLHNVEAEDHKLRLRYTREFSARLRDYYGIDADNLTDSVGALAFRLELNRRVFNEVYDNATLGGNSSWDYDVDTDGRWEEEKIKTLMTLLNFKSADILNANFMIPGNYIVIDPITYAFFSSYGYLDTSSLPGGMADPMKNAFVGVLNGMYRTYVNPWLRSRVVLMGSKDFSGDPAAETRAGLYFHPYLGLDITKTVQDASGQPVKFLWSMYGFTTHPMADTVGTNDFFRRVNIQNLPNV